VAWRRGPDFFFGPTTPCRRRQHSRRIASHRLRRRCLVRVPGGGRAFGSASGVSTPGHGDAQRWSGRARAEPGVARRALRRDPHRPAAAGIELVFGNDAEPRCPRRASAGCGARLSTTLYLTKIGRRRWAGFVDGQGCSPARWLRRRGRAHAARPAVHRATAASRGCVETYVGEAALLRLAERTAPPSRDSVAEVLRAARRRRAGCLRGVRGVAVALGRTIANLVNLAQPPAVIMGGSLASVLGTLPGRARGRAGRAGDVRGRRGVELRTAGLGDDSSLMGAPSSRSARYSPTRSHRRSRRVRLIGKLSARRDAPESPSADNSALSPPLLCLPLRITWTERGSGQQP